MIPWDPKEGMYRVSFLSDPQPIDCQYRYNVGYYRNPELLEYATCPYRGYDPEVLDVYEFYVAWIAVWKYYEDLGPRKPLTKEDLYDVKVHPWIMHRYNQEELARGRDYFPEDHDNYLTVNRHPSFAPFVRMTPTRSSIYKKVRLLEDISEAEEFYIALAIYLSNFTDNPPPVTIPWWTMQMMKALDDKDKADVLFTRELF